MSKLNKLSKEIKSLYIDIGSLTFFYALNVAKHGKTEEEAREYQRQLAKLVECGMKLMTNGK